MSKDTRDARRVVNVGNSWLLCHSKSYPGHVYYFNSLTGETAWNLSDAEIEKAKQRTKRLEPGAKPTKYPEPKDKPPSAPVNSAHEPSQSLSTHEDLLRISDQQSSVFSCSNVNNNSGTFGNPFTQITGVMQGSQISNPSGIQPVCHFNSLSSFHLNSTPTVYNPNVWAVPQTQQIVFGPGLAPVVNHSLAPLNVGFNHFLPHHVSQPATGQVFNSFENGNQSEMVASGTRPFNLRNINHDQGVKRPISKKQGFTNNKNDLRTKLNWKKKIIPGGSGLSNPRNVDIAAHIADKFEGLHFKDESRCVDSQLHEAPSKINLEPLKSLAPPDSNTDVWFLVVDLTVLLQEFKFLTTLSDSDEKCCLMVPNRVMEELKNYVKITGNIQAKRILRFLSPQIEMGYAFLAKEPSEIEDDSLVEAIYKTCKELLENQYHLILLTNDNELWTKCSSNINVFRIDEIKNFLTGKSNKQLISTGPKKPLMSDELINKIQIIVPNDASLNIDTIHLVRDSNKDCHDDNIPKTPFKQSNTQNKTEELIILKHTVDAGIQTDLEDINASLRLNSAADSSISPFNSKTTTENAVPLVTPREPQGNIHDKKREIKLKRRTSHQPQVNYVDSEKKQFKWRRRRNASEIPVNEPIPSQNGQNMNTKHSNCQETNPFNNEVTKLPDRILHNNLTIEIVENTVADDSIESRESSIYTEPISSTAKENITIEETSTSDIISNTESNVDADSNCSISNNSVNQQAVYNGKSMKPMYEVDSITMEQYLRVKCDEWISRFIQIMEEVLTQLLQQDPPFAHDAMPPPWSVHEAAQCIAIKFRGNQSIMTAANKLSNILFHVSDANGKITMNMTPYQYMQMYSYGAHLLAAIREVTNNCEDIQIAVESLNRLLQDIRNPNLDSSTNDTFSDGKRDLANNDESPAHSDVPCISDDQSLHEEEMLPDCNKITDATEKQKDSSEKGKLSEQEDVQHSVKFIRNIDIPYSFLSLSLQKRKTTNTARSPIQQREDQLLTYPHKGEETSQPQNANEITKKVADSDVPTNEPKIIRKFGKCSKFEEKLKMNNYSNFNEDEELDYDECYGESEDNCSENNEQRNNVNDNQTDEGADTNEHASKSLTDDDSSLRNDNNKKFKYMMYSLSKEIRNALWQVKILCDQCYKMMNIPDQSMELNGQGKMVEKARLLTIRVIRSLESMLAYERCNPIQGISHFLEEADIDIRHVDANLIFEYRITIENFNKHAHVFLKVIQNIISGNLR